MKLSSKALSLAPFEEIRKKHLGSLFAKCDAVAAGSSPSRLVKVCAENPPSNKLNETELQFHIRELTRNAGVFINAVELAGFLENTKLKTRCEWLKTLFQSTHINHARLQPTDARIHTVMCDVPNGLNAEQNPRTDLIRDAITIASTVMIAQGADRVYFDRRWLSSHDSLWRWLLYSMFSSSATHCFSSLSLTGHLKTSHSETIVELLAARNPRALLLDSKLVHGFGTLYMDPSDTPMQALVAAGVELTAWRDGLLFSATRVRKRHQMWKLEEDSTFDVLAKNDRHVLVLVPFVGVCSVLKSHCKFFSASNQTNEVWRLDNHPIRHLALNMEPFGSFLWDESDAEDADDEEETPESHELGRCRFIMTIGRPLISMCLTFDMDEIIDGTLAALPHGCPNLKHLEIQRGTLQSFKSVVNVFNEGLELESLTTVWPRLLDGASIGTLTTELSQPSSAMAKSLRRVHLSVMDRRWHKSLLRGMHHVVLQNHNLRCVTLTITASVFYSYPASVEAIRDVRLRYRSWPLPMRTKLAFICALEAASRPRDAAGLVPSTRIMAQFDSMIASLILQFAAEREQCWGDVGVAVEAARDPEELNEDEVSSEDSDDE